MTSEFFSVLAASDAQRRLVRRVREEAFSRHDARLPCWDAYDEAPNCWSFLLHSPGDSRAIGSVRACIYTQSYEWLPIPAFELYGEEIRSSVDLDSGMVQATHFCMRPTDRVAALRPKLSLIGEVLKTALGQKAGHVISVISDQPARLRFYARLGFSPIASARRHPILGRSVVLIGAPTDRFLASVQSERVFQSAAVGITTE